MKSRLGCGCAFKAGKGKKLRAFSRIFLRRFLGLRGWPYSWYTRVCGALLHRTEEALSRTNTIRAGILYEQARRYAQRGHNEFALALYDVALANQPSWRVLARDRLDCKRGTLPRTIARDRADFQHLQSFCAFIGYPRSGHSLIGAIIDAHPEACIAHEADALGYVAHGPGLPRDELLELLAENSEVYYRFGRRWQGHDYDVTRQPLALKTLRVIGDKKGDATIGYVSQRPDLLNDLREYLKLDLRIVHVFRNPFDNIARIALRDGLSIRAATNKYFRLVSYVQEISESDNVRIHHLPNEHLIHYPEDALRDLFAFLSLEASPELLSKLKALVYVEPNRSRYDVIWSQEDIENVLHHKEGIAWLKEYEFEDE